VSSVLAARLFLWPRLQNLGASRALTALVVSHMLLRFLGLSFLVPGVVSPLLPTGFAIPPAYGDFLAAVLAIITTFALVNRTSLGQHERVAVQSLRRCDLLYAFYQGRQIGLPPGMLGAGFFVVTALVPPLLVSHALIFLLLARYQSVTGLDCGQGLKPGETPCQAVR